MLMSNDSENGGRCKDGAENRRLSELLEAFDKLGYRVFKAETNGTDFELKIRCERKESER